MEKYSIDKDIEVLCVTAASFPDGILAAHQKLHAMISFADERRYFGISRPGADGVIVYKAAAEVLNEGGAFGLETFTIKKGEYSGTVIHNYMQDSSGIGIAFKELLTDPRLDPEGACVEMYLSDKDVRCMVRLKS